MGQKAKLQKCVELWGTRYRPDTWLQEPDDEDSWIDNEPSKVIRVEESKTYKSTDSSTYVPEEWTVQLDNGAKFVNIRKKRTWYRPSAAILSLSWLGQAYEAQFWFWEMIEFSRKFVLSAVVVFVQPGTSSQILMAIFVCVIFLGLVSFYKPYELDDDDTFSFISFICLVFSLVLGLALKYAETDKTTIYMRVVFALLMLTVNILMMFMLITVLLEKLCGIKLSAVVKKIQKSCKKKNKIKVEDEEHGTASSNTNAKRMEEAPLDSSRSELDDPTSGEE